VGESEFVALKKTGPTRPGSDDPIQTGVDFSNSANATGN